MIKNPQDRFEALRPMVESLGGRYVNAWLAPQHGMAIGLFDIPDPELIGALTLAVQASGAASSIRVIPVVSHADAVRLFERAGAVGYQPPG